MSKTRDEYSPKETAKRRDERKLPAEWQILRHSRTLILLIIKKWKSQLTRVTRHVRAACAVSLRPECRTVG